MLLVAPRVSLGTPSCPPTVFLLCYPELLRARILHAFSWPWLLLAPGSQQSWWLSQGRPQERGNCSVGLQERMWLQRTECQSAGDSAHERIIFSHNYRWGGGPLGHLGADAAVRSGSQILLLFPPETSVAAGLPSFPGCEEVAAGTKTITSLSRVTPCLSTCQPLCCPETRVHTASQP